MKDLIDQELDLNRRKEMLEEFYIACEQDTESQFIRKWFPNKKTSLDKALDIFNNNSNNELLKLMLRRNNLETNIPKS